MINEIPSRIIQVVLSGSFKRDTDGLARAYIELHRLGCHILSPHSLDFVSNERGFVKTEAEQDHSFAELQRHHLLSITEADFVWLHAPDGYVGTSAGFEIGFATAKGIPVYSRNQPYDPAIESYVTVCNSVIDALYLLK